MPDGVILWFDPASGDARVARGGREYAARAKDIESAARHGGARVHFDIEREDGVERAVEVQLRAGSRTDRHHHRVGSLVGAHAPDTRSTAPFARPHPDQGRALAGHPLSVVTTWAHALLADDVDVALAMYAPDAVVTEHGEPITGRRALRALLDRLPVRGNPRDPIVAGEGPDQVVARWERATPDGEGLEVHSVLRHGEIAEQHLVPLGPESTTVEVEAGRPFVVNVTTKGAVADSAVEYARERVAHVVESLDQPVLFARVKLSRSADPAVERPAVAQATLDLDGSIVRAHVAAHSINEAIDLLQARLRDKLQHEHEHRDAVRRQLHLRREPGEWRHGAEPEHRPPFFDRPADEREIVRHKSFAADVLTPEEAAFELEQLDFDFHLFTELASGEDCVIERADGGGYRLHFLHVPQVDPTTGFDATGYTVDPVAVPALTVAEAVERLDVGNEHFVFFADAASGRGDVLYRRYDGHYGLITLDERP